MPEFAHRRNDSMVSSRNDLSINIANNERVSLKRHQGNWSETIVAVQGLKCKMRGVDCRPAFLSAHSPSTLRDVNFIFFIERR